MWVGIAIVAMVAVARLLRFYQVLPEGGPWLLLFGLAVAVVLATVAVLVHRRRGPGGRAQSARR